MFCFFFFISTRYGFLTRKGEEPGYYVVVKVTVPRPLLFITTAVMVKTSSVQVSGEIVSHWVECSWSPGVINTSESATRRSGWNTAVFFYSP